MKVSGPRTPTHALRDCLVTLCFLVLAIPGTGRAIAGTVSERLATRLRTLETGGTVPVIVSFADRVDPFSVKRREVSASGMIRSLRGTLTERHDALRARMGADWTTGTVTLLWINQTLGLDATRGLVERLSGDPAVDRIELNDGDVTCAPTTIEPVLTDPAKSGSPTTADVASSTLALPWNITITGVDSVWETYGLDGDGILIGSLDTGIDPSHPALVGKLRPSNAWKDFIFFQTSPYDNMGHGTFGSGIIAGANGDSGTGPGVGIGIAYRSRMVVGKMLDAGATPIVTVVEAMQWMLDPDENPETDDFPRVVNNSWFSGTRGSTYAFAAAEAWRAAGIIPVFCAGNAGPATGSTRSPGDYKNSISVGGTDINDDRYNATSVGPSPTDPDYFPLDGRKPDVSAPGEAVYSSSTGGTYGASSGTSWSAPHVTGIIALMLQANPTLEYDRILAILEESAVDLGTGGYDYVFGYGRVSAMGAVSAALRSRIGIVAPGELSTSEEGAGDSFTVALTVPPSDTVCLAIALSDTTEGYLSKTSICFTPSDWTIPQRIYVTGKDDGAWDGDIAYSITMTTTSDESIYDGIVTLPLNVVNVDDEDVISTTFSAGWNLVSLPAIRDDRSVSSIFPAAISAAFAYDSSYTEENSLRRGAGYWLKFGASGEVEITGGIIAAETVAVAPGWNLVGSASGWVAVSGISIDPPTIVLSRFFGYENGYSVAEIIEPGKGYWVKADGAGILILSP